mmetsp:Transcript_14286/g.36147  ORF Transcript_14286/g.36147 Transcript_14286/m.36147 type:complete len:130 (+) Transcript_14286:214-603(+)
MLSERGVVLPDCEAVLPDREVVLSERDGIVSRTHVSDADVSDGTSCSYSANDAALNSESVKASTTLSPRVDDPFLGLAFFLFILIAWRSFSLADFLILILRLTLSSFSAGVNEFSILAARVFPEAIHPT